MTALEEAWARTRSLAWADRVILLLLAAHVGLKLLVFSQVGHSPFIGDESAYANGGMALSNLLRDLGALRSPDVAELQRNVVGSGWFMPGMSLLLAPLYLVAPHADPGIVRAYVGVISLVLLLVVVVRVRRILGPLAAGALVVMPGLVPTWAAFSFAMWGDLIAGLVAVLFVVSLVEMTRTLRAGEPLTCGGGASLGLLAIMMVYLRSSASLLVLALGLAMLVAALVTASDSHQRLRAIVSMGLAGLVAGLLLLPWSLAASTSLGDTVVTTTSVPISLANTFGDRGEVCFGPCDPGLTPWFSPLSYSRETARATGRSEVGVLRQMRSYALRDVTARSYARDVVDNVRTYTSEPQRFYGYLGAPDGRVRAAAEGLTRLMMSAAWAAGILLLLTVFRRPRETQVLALLVTLALASLLAQPFVHVAGSRYWTTPSPLLGLAGAVLVGHLTPARLSSFGRSRRGALRFPHERHVDRTLGRWLSLGQLVVTVVTVTTAATLLGLSHV